MANPKTTPLKIRVCRSGSCRVFGSGSVMEEIIKRFGLQPGESNTKYDLDWSGCLGYCGQGPNICLNDEEIVTDCVAEDVLEKIDEQLRNPQKCGHKPITDEYQKIQENDFLSNL